jgi:serine/threonine protein kinase
MQNWPEGFKHAVKKGINFAEYTEIQLSTVIPECPKDALDFIAECIRWDPTKRATASQLLNHSFLTGIDQQKYMVYVPVCQNAVKEKDGKDGVKKQDKY